MPFEERGSAARRIAVIGGGISGMGAAWHLSESSHVVLFESEPRLGGHARTVVAGRNGDQPVDTGFIVFNHKTYPHLTRLFDALDVPTTESDMSFGVSARNGGIEYALNSIDTVFAQRRNLARPAFLRMIGDIQLFNRHALSSARLGMTIADLIAKLNLGPWFVDYYLTPFSGAIWSTPKSKILDFPADALVQFFKNHGILDWNENHQWYTVKGGSIEYVRRLQSAVEARGVDVRLGAPIQGVRRRAFGADVRVQGGDWEPFDAVVFATHSDDTLRMLSDPTGVERTALSAIRYQPNRAVLHSDASVMPKRKKVWSSWTYVEDSADPNAPIALSYWMNSLQPIPKSDPLFVTLNREAPIREDAIYDECVFRHPVFDAAALAAQDTIRAINGQNRTWYCGAWMRHGFHEDGLASAVEVAGEIMAENTLAMAAE